MTKLNLEEIERSTTSQYDCEEGIVAKDVKDMSDWIRRIVVVLSYRRCPCCHVLNKHEPDCELGKLLAEVEG